MPATNAAREWRCDAPPLGIGRFCRFLYANDIFGALEPLAAKLGRAINPTVYSRRELARRRKEDNAFVTRVLAQPKVWIIGAEDDLPT